MQIKIQFETNKYAYISADVFARSAFNSEVTLDEFYASLDNFSADSISSIEQINLWREEAVNTFFDLLVASSKVTLSPEEFLGGSDYEEDNGTTPDIDTKK